MNEFSIDRRFGRQAFGADPGGYRAAGQNRRIPPASAIRRHRGKMASMILPSRAGARYVSVTTARTPISTAAN
jgi:hypothetical protein